MILNFDFIINHESDIPKYQQIIHQINEGIAKDILAIDDPLPSVNTLCLAHNLSRDTVFKAYSLLKKNGVIKSVPNKGYYVASKNRKVLLVLDTFKAYKEVLYHSFINFMDDDVITDIQFHHYNSENFKTIITNSIGKYYKYVIMGFDHLSVPKLLSKIDQNKLLLIDWNIHAKKDNNYVFQDFGNSFYLAIKTVENLLKKYKEFHFIYPTFTNHPKETITYFKKFCIESKISYRVITSVKDFQIESGIAYISVSDRILGVFLEQCREKNLEPGVDVGFLSYNETPMKKFIYKGISVITTDFEALGMAAAKFINKNEAVQLYIPTKIILRDSL